MKQANKFIIVIAFLGIMGGLFSIVSSPPWYTIYNSVQQGGLLVNDRVRVMQVAPDSPAARAGLIPEDIIVSVNGQPINKASDFVEISSTNQGQAITVTMERDGNIRTVQLTPRVNPPSNQGRVGAVLSNSRVIKKPFYEFIPQVVIRGYAGYEELSLGLFSSVPYHDKTLGRLRELILGIAEVVIGLGLLKLKRWAMYGFIMLTGYDLVAYILYFINVNTYMSSEIQAPLSYKSDNSWIIISTIALALQIFFAWYIYKKKLFY